MQDLYLIMPKPDIVADFKRLARLAVALGAILAWVCPLLPDNYRAPCEALHQLCQLGAGGQ